MRTDSERLQHLRSVQTIIGSRGRRRTGKLNALAIINLYVTSFQSYLNDFYERTILININDW